MAWGWLVLEPRDRPGPFTPSFDFRCGARFAVADAGNGLSDGYLRRAERGTGDCSRGSCL